MQNSNFFQFEIPSMKNKFKIDPNENRIHQFENLSLLKIQHDTESELIY